MGYLLSALSQGMRLCEARYCTLRADCCRYPSYSRNVIHHLNVSVNFRVEGGAWHEHRL
jgi:hypothetical protein